MTLTTSVFVASVFMVCTSSLIFVIYLLNRRRSPLRLHKAPQLRHPGVLDATKILEMEFGYALSTAHEAMQDRHTMVNFYFLAVGIATSGSIALLGDKVHLPNTTTLTPVTGTLVLWTLCLIGWIYFLSVIRLRQAWCESAMAMNQIKMFYIEHAERFEPGELARAFRWHEHTRPRANKPWTVFFYSAMLIAFLNSSAFLGGGALLTIDTSLSGNVDFWPTFWILLAMATFYLLFHRLMYSLFLSESMSDESSEQG